MPIIQNMKIIKEALSESSDYMQLIDYIRSCQGKINIPSINISGLPEVNKSHIISCIIHDIKNQETKEEIFIIGGGSIYATFLPFATNLYLTEVDSPAPDADVFFPEFDKTKYKKTIIKKGSENDLNYQIICYQQ